MINEIGFINIAAALLLSPLLFGLINRTKAKFAGRRGAPILQCYYDIIKLLRKGEVISSSSTWLLRFGPAVSLASMAFVLVMLPLGSCPAILSFSGDIILVVYLLAVARFFIVLTALDVGSSFEGMGASREVTFSALAEPALLICLATLARGMSSLSLSGIYSALSFIPWGGFGIALLLVAIVLFVILLAENSRIPVDDPNTHLELTMIHEVMVLDSSGPDLAFILYGSALKLWIFCALFAGIVFPLMGSNYAISLLAQLAMIFLTAIMIGVVESTMARLKMPRVPQLLSGAVAIALLAFLTSFLVG